MYGNQLFNNLQLRNSKISRSRVPRTVNSDWMNLMGIVYEMMVT